MNTNSIHFAPPRCLGLALLALACLSLVACMGTDQANDDQRLVLRTQSVPPISFLQDGQPVGLSVAVMQALMAETGTDADIEIVAWQTAYETALGDGQHGVFSTVMTAERKPLFQWVGPIVLIETAFYARADQPIQVHNLDQARAVSGIATVTDYYSDEWLRQAGGFDNVQRFGDEAEALQALLTGQVDLMIGVNVAMADLLRRMAVEDAAVQRVFSVSSDLAYLALSKAVPTEQVQRWQHALDEMKADGRFNALYAQWLPNEQAPGRLNLFTEDYPPVTFMRDGQPAGIVSEMVMAMMTDLGLDEPVRLTAWRNAYALAQVHPNTVLFSMDRTPAREGLFKWVGPVASNTAAFYARADAELEVNDLAAARAVAAIATTSDWWTETALQEAGFTNLVSAPHPSQNVQALMAGEVDLSIFTDLTVAEIVSEAGYSLNDLKPVFSVDSHDIYIALSIDTSDEEVARWQAALDQLKADGRFAAIYQRYLPNADIHRLVEATP